MTSRFSRIFPTGWCCGLLLLAAAPVPAFAGFFTSFFKHDVEVITVTDATPAGALLRTPSSANPVYYMAIDVGYHDFGGVIAGDKIPPKQEVVKNMARILAKQGYLPATKAHPPTLLLMWAWGTMNTDTMPDPNSPDMDGVQMNRNQILRFLGGYKVGLISKQPEPFSDTLFPPGVMPMDSDAESINDLATEDLYVVAIAAYDFRAATQKKKVLLWTTKISCPSRGLVMSETLPAMLALAGPNIGKDTAKPVWVRATDKFKPDVKIGDPSVVEYLDKGQLPVIDATNAPLKAPSKLRKK